ESPASAAAWASRGDSLHVESPGFAPTHSRRVSPRAVYLICPLDTARPTAVDEHPGSRGSSAVAGCRLSAGADHSLHVSCDLLGPTGFGPERRWGPRAEARLRPSTECC